MPGLTAESPTGALREGWSAAVGDYAIAGGWVRDGDMLVVGDAAGGVYGFHGTSGATAWSQSGVHEGGLLALAIHPAGTAFATAGQDGRILLWNASDGQITQAIDVGDDWVEHLSWAPAGPWLAATCSRQARVYDGADGTEAWRSEDHPSTVSAIAWSSAEELATACYGQVAFFEVPSGELRQKLEWIGSLVSMVLSPNGDIVACGSQDRSVHFWRRSTGDDSEMCGYPGKPSALAFDDSGTLLATGGGHAVTVWSFRDKGPEGTKPGFLELHAGPIKSLAFAPRGRRLASGARDGGVVVWSLRRNGAGKPKGMAQVADVISALCWRPDGRALAALDADGGVTAWRVYDK